MKAVPIGAKRKFVTQSDKEKCAAFALISLYHYRNIPESLRQTIPAYWLLLDSGATVSVSQDDSLMINIVMSSDLVFFGSLRALQSYSQGRTLCDDFYQEG